MTALRTFKRPMPALSHDGARDVCGGYRFHGNYRSCSKKRQQRYAQARKGNE